MKKLKLSLVSAGMALMSTLTQAAVVSGSTGENGAFSPTVNTQVVLPPSGILNYTTVNIPTGVTVTFKSNATNTPVVILASGNVTIAGTLWVGGGPAAATGSAGNGVLSDDGTPGAGGPGGYSGGKGGEGTIGGGAGYGVGGFGLGPGGGGPGKFFGVGSTIGGGGGGGFGASGGVGQAGSNWGVPTAGGAVGAAYGNSRLLPLIGGSGGGGGGGASFNGGGGGGGGGAILIASNGTVNVTGTINADGGVGGAASGSGLGGSGGGGAGGAIRIVATTITGNGNLFARGNTAGPNVDYWNGGGTGGIGRIRLEAEVFTRTAVSEPVHSQGPVVPGSIFVAGFPTLRIDSVGGIAVPVEPTGNADVTLPTGTANPLAVAVTTTGVPAGNTVKISLKPAIGAEVTATSPALVGDTTSATASVNINFPNGPSTLLATVTYTITLAMGDALSVYALGERVEKITLASNLGSKESTITLITVSGKEFVVPAGVLAAMPG